MALRRRVSPVICVCLVPAGGGRGAGDEEKARQAVVEFLERSEAGDGEAACRLLSPRARRQLIRWRTPRVSCEARIRDDIAVRDGRALRFYRERLRRATVGADGRSGAVALAPPRPGSEYDPVPVVKRGGDWLVDDLHWLNQEET